MLARVALFTKPYVRVVDTLKNALARLTKKGRIINVDGTIVRSPSDAEFLVRIAAARKGMILVGIGFLLQAVDRIIAVCGELSK